MSPSRYVGKGITRSDALEKAMGRALFAVDLKLPDMLCGRILRSPFAHARIRAIDASRAMSLPGVKAVITREDIEGRLGQYGMTITDQSVVATDKVRFVGDPVAAVAAVDADTAEEALSCIDVQYEELPCLLTIEDALAPGAPLLHDHIMAVPPLRDLLAPEQGTNICTHFKLRHGDVEEGFRRSALLFEDTFTTEPVYHATLEPHCAIAKVLPGPRIEVVSNNQDPSNLQAQLSQVFGVPQSSIRIVIPYVGGGFGSKISPKLEPIAVALAWKAARPVKLVLDREEDFLMITRHGTKVVIKTGVAKDGTLVARQIAVYFDKGAYADIGPVVTKNSGLTAAGPYRIPHVKIDAYSVYTNKVPGGAMRGFGIPQVAWAYEQQMDIIAERLGLDPLELRQKNLLVEGDLFHSGQVMEDIALGQLLDRAAAGIGWGDQGRKLGTKAGIVSRGKGISIGMKGTGTPSTSGALVKMHADGSVSLMCNTVEMGQGIRTVFSQIIADELALPIEKILVADPDVTVAPFDSGTQSSRSTFHMGNAILLATGDLKRQLLDAASVMLDAPQEELEFADGSIRVKEVPDKSLPLALAVKGPGVSRGSLTGRGTFQTSGTIAPGTAQGIASFFWMSAAGGVEVEVDRETGVTKVLRYVGVVDAGRMINPSNIEQQNMGSIVMALGQAFTERLIYGQKGELLNADFVDYKIPTIKDLPDELIASALEVTNRNGPYGAKGIGEVMIVPPLPAIANALYRATGVRFRSLPLTPEKVLEGLMEMEESAAGLPGTGGGEHV